MFYSYIFGIFSLLQNSHILIISLQSFISSHCSSKASGQGTWLSPFISLPFEVWIFIVHNHPMSISSLDDSNWTDGTAAELTFIVY